MAALGHYVAIPATAPSGLPPVCYWRRRRILKMACVANCLGAVEADERIRSLWEGRANFKARRQRHDSWLTNHGKLGDNPDYISLFRCSATLLPKPMLKKKRMLEQLFGP